MTKTSAVHWPTCRNALEKPLRNMYAYSPAELNPSFLNSSQLFGEAKEKKPSILEQHWQRKPVSVLS